MIPALSDWTDAISIDVFVEMPGIPTQKLLSDCLYVIDDPGEIVGIVTNLNAVKLTWETQRKASNWLIFQFPNRGCMKTDLDEEASELRVTTNEWKSEYRISAQACGCLRRHIQNARPLYEHVYRIEELT